MRRLRPYANAVFVGLTAVLLIGAAAEAVVLWQIIEDERSLGIDLVFFRDVAQRWLETGELYLERQLAGPYVVETLVDVLYPPFALYLFVPFLVLPAFLWWAIPITVFVAAIARLRPARWTWPLIAAGIAWPQTVSQVIYGNTNMWVAAAIAAGAVWAWPAPLVLLKPSLAPFAVVGIWRRSWWIGVAVLALAAIPFGSLWTDYAVALRNSSLVATHALVTLPLMLVPLVAWIGRERRRGDHLEPDPSAQAVPDVHDLTIVKIE